MRYDLLCASIVGGVAAFHPAVAEACQCLPPERRVLQPATGATDVPTNTRLWIAVRYVTLEDDAGNDVELEFSEVRTSSGTVNSFRPVVELQPNSRYTMRGSNGFASSFTTGEGPDTTAPAVPSMEILDSWWRNAGSCGDELLVHAEPVHEGAILAVRTRNRGDEFDPVAWTGWIDDVFGGQRAMFLGNAHCFSNVAEASPGGTAAVRLLSIDLAGNVSEWSPDITIGFADTYENPYGEGTGGRPGAGGAGGSSDSGGGGRGAEGGHGGTETPHAGSAEPPPASDGCSAAGATPSILALGLTLLGLRRRSR